MCDSKVVYSQKFVKTFSKAEYITRFTDGSIVWGKKTFLKYNDGLKLVMCVQPNERRMYIEWA